MLRLGEDIRDPRNPRAHLHHCNIDGGSMSRRRGLLGGCFGGVLAAQSHAAPTPPLPYHGYVADGLFAYYDAIDNTGAGDSAHSDNASVWVDLCGVSNITLNGETWGSNYISSNSKMIGRTVTSTENSSLKESGITVEAYFHLPSEVVAQQWFVGTFRGYPGYCIYRTSDSLVAIKASPLVYAGNQRTHDIDLGISGQSSKVNGAFVSKYIVNGSTVTHTGTLSINDYTSYQNKICLNGDGRYDMTVSGVKYYALRVYSRALTDEEVAANHAVDVARFSTT